MGGTFSVPHELIRSFLSWILILPTAFLTGSWYRSLVYQKDPLLRGIIYYALGFATLSYAVVALGALNALTPRVIWGILVLFFFIRLNKIGVWFQWLTDVREELLFQKDLPAKILFSFFVIAFLGLFLGTLTPELGGDALCYHLNLPKIFLRQGSLTPDVFDLNTFFPLFMNNLYLIGLATGGVFAAKLFHFFTGFLLFLAMKRIFRNATGNPWIAYFVGLVVLTTPAIYNTLSTTYVDVALAFYVFLSLVTLISALETGAQREFLLSGLLSGCCVAIKYLGFISVVGLACVLLYDIIVTRRLRAHLAGGLCFLTGLLIASGYWFVRNWLLKGNPFFPYWGAVWGDAHPQQLQSLLFGFPRSWVSFFSLYFNMFYFPGSFGSFATRIGIFYFLFTPFILLVMVCVPQAKKYGIFWFVFTVALFFLVQVDRYFISVLPAMALCAGFGIHWLYGFASPLLKRVLRMGGGSIAILILGIYVLGGTYHYRYAYLRVSGQWSVRKYLAALERTAPIAEWINKNLPQDAKILVESETRLFYFDRPVVRREMFEWITSGGAMLSSPHMLLKLLQDHGITHILSSDLIREGKAIQETQSYGKELRSAGDAWEIQAAESQNIRDDRYNYRVFEIKKG